MSSHSIVDLATFNEKVRSESALVFCFGMGTTPQYKSILSRVRLVSSIYGGFKYYGVDVNDDRASEIATELKLKQMPILLVYKAGQKIDEAVSPDLSRILELIMKVV